ncbi:MAG: Ig-like domain-containing protein, partial [Candidatus Thorarchaeota archaeon]|jgi:hypothetical protein
LWDSLQVSLTVENSNDPPMITNKIFHIIYLTEDTKYTYDFEAEDEDPTADILTWFISSGGDIFSIGPTNGLLDGTPENSDVGFTQVCVNVTDNNGGFDHAEFTVKVNNTNDPPIIQTSSLDDAQEDEMYWQILNATDIDQMMDLT